MSGCANSKEPRRLMMTPRSVDLAITTRCNLRCVYCSHFDSPGEVERDLPAEEWLKFFEELTAAAVMDVTLSGGEALIRKDFKELVNGIVKNRMRFSLLSNGTLINNDIAEFLASTGRCGSVQISIDGPDSKIHDLNCGKGSFEAALRGLKCLMKHGINCTVRLTISRNNIDHLEEAAELLLEEVGLRSFSTNSVCPFGMGQTNSDMVTLCPQEYARAMTAHHNIIKKYGNRVNSSAGPLSSYKHWTEMEKARRENAPGKPGYGYLTSCNGVFSKLAVRADGVIVPCGLIPHIELGRINRDSLVDIWQKHPELKNLRERQQTPLADFEYCGTCDYVNYCRGGCPANAYNLSGDVNKPVPSGDSCYRRFLEEGGVLPVFED